MFHLSRLSKVRIRLPNYKRELLTFEAVCFCYQYKAFITVISYNFLKRELR